MKSGCLNWNRWKIVQSVRYRKEEWNWHIGNEDFGISPKNTMERLNNRLSEAEQRISELDHKCFEISHSGKTK